jgi:aspartate/methionine/tyrosine aminotransferase
MERVARNEPGEALLPLPLLTLHYQLSTIHGLLRPQSPAIIYLSPITNQETTMTHAPLEKPELLLPPHIRSIVDRDTPIPTIALRAAKIKKETPTMVRADIGQISEVDTSLEVYYGPPVGLDELRSLLAETWNRCFGWDTRGLGHLPKGLEAKNVVVCTGAAEALSVLFHCFAHNKKVGLPKGHWENYTNGVEMAGGSVVLLDFFDAEGRLDIPGITKVIQEQNISLIVANFPCNPTGAVLNTEENRAFGEMLQKTNCVAIADEVYCRLRYDGHAPTSLLEAAPGHVVSIGSVSKEYLLPGVRVGYIFSTNADFTDRMLRRLIRANTASPNVLGQKRALALMESDLKDIREGRAPQLLSKVREEMKERRDRLVTILEAYQMPTVGRAKHIPEGTIFLMAGLPSWWKGTDVELTERFLEEACVSVVPGSAFGMERCVRFSFGGLSVAQLAQLEKNLASFKAKFA